MTSIEMATVRPASSRGRVVVVWAARALLIAAFASSGVQKLAGTPQMVAGFEQMGAGQWFRYLIGALEVAGAVGLLVPVLAGPAALGLTGLMIGAVITNVVVLHTSPVPPLMFLVLSVVVARALWPRTKALARAVRRS